MIALYDWEGNGITVDEWLELVGNEKTATVALHYVGDIEVSTIWIGIDFSNRPKPLIFETMVFLAGEDVGVWRWATLGEASAGHEAIVERLRQEAGK